MRGAEIWAILPSQLQIVAEALADMPQAGDIKAAARPAVGQAGAVAILPIHGIITHRAGLWHAFGSATSTDGIGDVFAQAIENPGVRAIVLDIDSPGGSVAGVPELADAIYSARGRKPIIAVSNALMASAAYWIGSQADEVYVTPSSQTGSIGVYAVHLDYSRQLDARGVTATVISAGKYKAEGNEFSPLSEEARASWQAQVDEYYDMFVETVARGRGRQPNTVRNGFGEGRVLTASSAVSEHLADKVGGLEQAIGRAAALAKRQANAKAAAMRLTIG